jgi:hypothetical protein
MGESIRNLAPISPLDWRKTAKPARERGLPGMPLPGCRESHKYGFDHNLREPA